MLIRDSEILKQYSQLSSGNYEKLKPTLRMVEDKFVIPIISEYLYKKLDDALTDSLKQEPVELPEKYVTLLDMCRRVIGPMFCALHADKSDVIFSETGIQRMENSTNKTAYQYQGTKFKQANLQEAEDATELLIAFLEADIENYPEWENSDNFKKYRSLFIKTGGEFDEYFKTHSPRRNYYTMRNKMQEVEIITIKKLLGPELYKSLKEKDAEPNPTFSEEELELLPYLKRITAYLTVSLALPLLNVRMAENGISVLATASFSQNDNENTRAGISVEEMNILQKTCTDGASTWIEETIAFIKENKDAFPDWIGFAVPAEPTPVNINENNKTVFSI